MNRNVLILVGLALVLVVANGLIVRGEQVSADGRRVFLRIRPVDPRSLMQGDYMALSYQVQRRANASRAGGGANGQLVLRLDERDVATLDRFYDAGEELASDEVLIGYRSGESGIEVGSDAWFFEEGTGEQYEPAVFAEYRVAEDGRAVLVRLTDERLVQLGQDRARWWRGGDSGDE